MSEAGRLLSPAADTTDTTAVVIVGSGAAGLTAAWQLATAGVATTLVTRDGLGDSNTKWAQGGLAAVWAVDDSAELHIADTLTAGAGLCDPAAVRDLVAEAPGAISRLMALGARFDAVDGVSDLHLEGGHSRRRILHAGDYSGAEVINTLLTALHRLRLQPNSPLTVREDLRVLDVLTDATGAACGVRCLAANGTVADLLAPAVVLATGGLGQLYRGTSNPIGATGDGIAMAWRAGASVRDLEFVQFHPTVLAVEDGGRGVLISEAVRGEGATLIDHTGAAVMAGRHPLGDLAPRDVVSATMQEHLTRTGADRLFLDGTHLTEAQWRSHFPTILTMCRERGVDPVTEPIPVRPGAHYLCGGVAADLSGRTDIPGLYAVGEVAATGVHGANRLASNSVPEALVAGQRVGELLSATRVAGELMVGEPAEGTAVALVDPAFRSTLQGAMSVGAGVRRTGDSLDRTAAVLAAAPHTTELTEAVVDVTNLTTVGALVVRAAAARTESRGTHRRLDHPDTRPEWARHLTVSRTGDPDEMEAA